MSFVGCQNEQKSEEKLIHSDLKIDERRKLLKNIKQHSLTKNKRHHLMDERALNYEVHKIISGTSTMMFLENIQRAVIVQIGTPALIQGFIIQINESIRLQMLHTKLVSLKQYPRCLCAASVPSLYSG